MTNAALVNWSIHFSLQETNQNMPKTTDSGSKQMLVEISSLTFLVATFCHEM